MTQVNFGFSLIVDYELCKVVSFLIYALKILVGIANIKISTLKPINVLAYRILNYNRICPSQQIIVGENLCIKRIRLIGKVL